MELFDRPPDFLAAGFEDDFASSDDDEPLAVEDLEAEDLEAGDFDAVFAEPDDFAGAFDFAALLAAGAFDAGFAPDAPFAPLPPEVPPDCSRLRRSASMMSMTLPPSSSGAASASHPKSVMSLRSSVSSRT